MSDVAEIQVSDIVEIRSTRAAALRVVAEHYHDSHDPGDRSYDVDLESCPHETCSIVRAVIDEIQPTLDLTLVLERRGQENRTPVFAAGGDVMLITPPISEDYWEYRVALAHGQAVVGFPKFSTVGIGFAIEEDWNTNLPYRVPAGGILKHIRHNKKFHDISSDDVLRAIEMVQAAALEDHGGKIDLSYPDI